MSAPREQVPVGRCAHPARRVRRWIATTSVAFGATLTAIIGWSERDPAQAQDSPAPEPTPLPTTTPATQLPAVAPATPMPPGTGATSSTSTTAPAALEPTAREQAAPGGAPNVPVAEPESIPLALPSVRPGGMTTDGS
jgi:hypothetical protein